MSKLFNTEGLCHSSFFSLVINSKKNSFTLGAQFFSQRVNGVKDLQSQARAQDTMDNNEEKRKIQVFGVMYT